HSAATSTMVPCLDTYGHQATDANGYCAASLEVPRFSGEYTVTAVVRGRQNTAVHRMAQVAVKYRSAATQYPGIALSQLFSDPHYVLSGGAGQNDCEGNAIESNHHFTHF